MTTQQQQDRVRLRKELAIACLCNVPSQPKGKQGKSQLELGVSASLGANQRFECKTERFTYSAFRTLVNKIEEILSIYRLKFFLPDVSGSSGNEIFR